MGRWITYNGRHVYITDSGEEVVGKAAVDAYRKEGGKEAVGSSGGGKDWVTHLKDPEKNAILQWGAATGSALADIRQAERDGSENDQVKAWHAALDQAPVFKGEVWRGMSVSKEESLGDLLSEGSTVTFDSSSSATKDPETAKIFQDPMRDVRVSLVLRTSTAADLSGLTGLSGKGVQSFSNAKEVIIRNGTHYRVSKVTRGGSSRWRGGMNWPGGKEITVELDEI